MDYFQAIFSDTWTGILAIFLLGMTVFVHELGHFFAAKKRGLKVERFSIGFGPKIFGWTGADGVEYRLSWIPLGGYVALPQLAEMSAIEGETKTDVEKLPPLSFTDKVIVAVAGPFFNLIFAFLLATVLWAIGLQVSAEVQTNVVGNIRATVETEDGRNVPGPAAAAGLKTGDHILEVDGQTVSNFSQIVDAILMGSGRAPDDSPEATLKIKRGERIFDLVVRPVYSSVFEGHRDIGIAPSAKIFISETTAGSAAAKAGLLPGDLLTHIDGNAITSLGTVRDYIAKTKDAPVKITYQRDGKTSAVTISPRLEINTDTKKPAYLIGIVQSAEMTSITIHVPPWTQIGEIFKRTGRSLASILNPRSDIGISDTSGPLGIIAHMQRVIKTDHREAIWFVTFINIALAVFNMLPIPVLDGGHVLLAIITKIRGRALPVNIVATVQGVMMLLLFSLMIFVTFNDGRRIWKNFFPPARPAPAQHALPEQPPQQQPAK